MKKRLTMVMILGFTSQALEHEFDITITSDPQQLSFQLSAETAKGSIHYPFMPQASAFGAGPHKTPETGGIDGTGHIYYLVDGRKAATNTGRYLYPRFGTAHDVAATVKGGAGRLAGVSFEVNDRGEVENIDPPNRAEWDRKNRTLIFKHTRIDFGAYGTQVALFLVTKGPDPTFWTPHGYETFTGPDPFYPFEFNPVVETGKSPRFLLPNNPDVAEYVIVAHNNYAPHKQGPPFNEARDGLPWSGKGNGEGLLSFSVDDEGNVYDVTQILAGTVIEKRGWYCIDDGAGRKVGMRVLNPDGNADIAAKIEDIPGIVQAVGTSAGSAQHAFEDRTMEFFGVAAVGDWAAAFGDYNDDGFVDLSAAGTIFRNVEGRKYEQMVDQMSVGIWGDINNDGHLDYVRVAPAGDIFYGDGKGALKGGPCPGVPATKECTAAGLGDINNDGLLDIYYCGGSGQADTLWCQDPAHEKKWVRVLEAPGAYGRSAVGCDFDGDNDIDFYISNYWLAPNWLWVSDGAGGSANRAAEFGAQGGNGHSIGACWGDVDNDGYFDIFAGNFAHPGQPESRFLRNLGRDAGYKFEDKGQCGVAFQESYASPTLGDYDNDGDLDLFFTTVYGGDAARLYRNDGNWTFTDVTGAAGIPRLAVTYQAAWADVDNDGDLDLLTKGKLFINTLAPGEAGPGNENHWLKVRLEGDGKTVNRSAIGASVRIKVGDKVLSRQVEGGGVGQSNQNDPTLHFGLGKHAGQVRVVIDWPNGKRQSGTSKVDRMFRVKMD